MKFYEPKDDTFEKSLSRRSDYSGLGETALRDLLHKRDERIAELETDRNTVAVILTPTLERLRQEAVGAKRDKLTGMPNGVQFDIDLQKRCKRVASEKFQSRRLGLIIVDADGLKRLNDDPRYGYEYGNKFLRCIAQSLEESVRTSDGDIVYRLHDAGDEFAALLYVDAHVDTLDFIDLAPGRKELFHERLEHNLSMLNIEDDLYLGASFGFGFFGSHERPGEFQNRIAKLMHENKALKKREFLRRGIDLSDNRKEV
jgi:diguanylate cyclase (GGDEF)-like protein